MKPKQMMLFAVAIGCGLVAMLGAQQVLSGNKPEEREQIKILVAKLDIEPGIALDKSNVEFKNWPVDSIPEGAITKEEEFTDHALKHRIAAKTPILIPELGPKGAFGVNSMIPTGMQVVSVSVDATMTHSGLLRAGSYVDITCSISRPSVNGGPQRFVVRNVLKRVRVFAVGDKVSGADSGSRDNNSAEVKVISFVVYPNQAKLLNYAKAVSEQRIQIAMLGEAGNSKEEVRDFDEDSYAAAANDLMGDKPVDPMTNLNTEPTSARAIPQPVQRPTQRPMGSSFSDYVKQQQVVAEVKDLGKIPTRPTWKIEIWTGTEKKVHELELPQQEITEEAPSRKPESVGDNWTAPFMQFFSTRRRIKKANVEETQSIPPEEVRPELSNDKSAAIPADTDRR